MRCPYCKSEYSSFSLYETADDYQDGVVECDNCGKQVATYNLTVVIMPDEDKKDIL